MLINPLMGRCKVLAPSNSWEEKKEIRLIGRVSVFNITIFLLNFGQKKIFPKTEFKMSRGRIRGSLKKCLICTYLNHVHVVAKIKHLKSQSPKRRAKSKFVGLKEWIVIF